MSIQNLRVSVVMLVGLAPAMFASTIYTQTNLVSDVPGLGAVTDPNLVNPWGLAASSGSPWWVSDNGSGKTTLYNGNTGAAQALVVTIPGTGGNPGTPTGMIFNSTTSFNSDLFIFATEDGTIAGWRGALGTTAQTLLDSSGSGAVYKGLAIATTGLGTYLYAADFHNNQITVVPGTGAPALTGNFTDPTLPAGYAPFNIQNLGGKLYVTYALQDAAKHDDVAGAGFGFVDVFDTNGILLQRLVSSGALNSPWGLAIAPSNFGMFSNDLLVGNFGDGTINAFDVTTGAALGTLTDKNGQPIQISGLWGLGFGNGGSAGPTNTLYFTAGINGEADGLFGELTATPEPSTVLLTLGGLGAMVAISRRRLHRN